MASRTIRMDERGLVDLLNSVGGVAGEDETIVGASVEQTTSNIDGFTQTSITLHVKDDEDIIKPNPKYFITEITD